MHLLVFTNVYSKFLKNETNKNCHQKKWCVIFFTYIKPVVCVLPCVCSHTHQTENITIDVKINGSILEK